MAQTAVKTCGNCERVFTEDMASFSGTSRWRLCSRGDLYFSCSCSSTLAIKRGKFSWFSPELTMSDRAKSVFNRLADKDAIPHFSAEHMELYSLVSDEKTTPQMLAASARRAPTIAAEIVALANCRSVAGAGQIRSIEHAIVFIGRSGVGEIVLTAGLKAIQFKTSLFKTADFWDDALLCGRIAEVIGKKFAPNVDSDEIYLSASLCNIGKIIAAICFPEAVDAFYPSLLKGTTNWSKAERAAGLLPHDILGEIAASLWGFPNYIGQAAAAHHTAPKVGDSASEAAVSDVVALANQFTHVAAGRKPMIDIDILRGCSAKMKKRPQEILKEIQPLIKELVDRTLS